MVFSREMKTGKNKVKHCIWNIVSDRIHIIIPNVTPFLCERIVKFIKISRLVELTRILWISWKQVKLWLKKKEMKLSYIGWSFLQTGIIIPINYNLFHPWTNWKESENTRCINYIKNSHKEREKIKQPFHKGTRSETRYLKV